MNSHLSIHLHQELHAYKCYQFLPSFSSLFKKLGKKSNSFLCSFHSCPPWPLLCLLTSFNYFMTQSPELGWDHQFVIQKLLIIELVDAGSQLLPICVSRGSNWGLLRGALGEISPARIQLANAQFAVFIMCPLLIQGRGGSTWQFPVLKEITFLLTKAS